MNLMSVNGRFVVKKVDSYKDLSPKQQIAGLNIPSGKVSLVPLELLMPAQFEVGGGWELVQQGSKIYVKEAMLSTQAFGKEVYQTEELGQFLIVESRYVEFIERA